MTTSKTAFVALVALVCAAFSAPAHAGPIQYCDPASPLYDARLCYDYSPHGGYGCDPYGPVYDPNYCAAQR